MKTLEMKTGRSLVLPLASLVALIAACGTKPPTPPENPDRDLPGSGTVPRTQHTPYVDDSGTPIPQFDAGICCSVRFAILSDGTETAVTLKGDLPPLSAGVALTLAQGIWSATACMPDSFDGQYYYEAQLPSQGSTPYLDYRVNFHAPTVATGNHEAENHFSFDGALTCADLSAAVHSDVSVPDAGVPVGGG